MSQANPLWGAPRIHGELLKLGIKVAPSTVAKYLRRHGKPPSQTWRAFLVNHAEQMASIDFFTVPTVTFRVLFVFVVLAHARRRVLHFQVTQHPTQEWTMQQIREACPWEQVLRYLLHGPLLGRVLGHLEVQHAASSMCQYHEHKQNPEGHGRNREEVDGSHLFRMIYQEGSPGLRRRLPVSAQIFGHRRWRHLDPQLE